MTYSARALGIEELSKAYRNGTLAPTAVIEEVLTLAEDSQPALGAFVTIARTRAMAEARALETSIRRGETLPPLAGIPVTVKDVIATAGIRTTHGSLAFVDNIPTKDAVSVARLRRAGAIIIGKTATPEFACRQTTSSPVSGITRNPWNRSLTPGGSSGGSAAATAAGIGTVSLVTDGGGSARLPAACTGIAGFKPTFGLIPFDAALDAFSGLGHIGLMGRTVTDVMAVLPVVAGPSSEDPISLCRSEPTPFARHDGRRALDGVRIGWRERLDDERVDPEIREQFFRALGVAADLGAKIDVVKGAVDPPLPIWRVLQHSIWAERYEDNPAIMPGIDGVINAGIKQARSLSARDLQAALHGRTRLFRQVQGWLDGYDAILSPTLTRPPLAADHPGSGPIEVAGELAGDIREAWAPLLGLFTMTGHPALSVNCGWTKDRLPIGLHLVGRWHEDERVLAIGAALEMHLRDQRSALPPLSSSKDLELICKREKLS